MIKKILLIICLIIISGCGKNEAIINEKDNNTFSYGDKIYLKDLISIENGALINEDEEFKYDNIGEYSVKINYKDTNNKKGYKSININIIDTDKPLLSISNEIKVEKNTELNPCAKAFYGDYFDPKPSCIITGDFDLNTIGIYPVKITIKDFSNNEISKDIKINVVDKITNSNNQYTESYDYIEDIIKKYKDTNNKIGIDVSGYQGEIDWKKVKESGVEFAIIRLGYGHTVNDEIVEDKFFQKNIEGAKENGIKVGVYFFTYANEIDEIDEQTKWIKEVLKDKELDLPIAFDFESWSFFENYELSFKMLNDFYDRFKSNLTGYETMLYGSKYYLNNVWDTDDREIWLAHYTEKTDYKKNYSIWQLSSTGKVDGINGYVDLDILYK